MTLDELMSGNSLTTYFKKGSRSRSMSDRPMSIDSKIFGNRSQETGSSFLFVGLRLLLTACRVG